MDAVYAANELGQPPVRRTGKAVAHKVFGGLSQELGVRFLTAWKPIATAINKVAISVRQTYQLFGARDPDANVPHLLKTLL